MLSAYSGLEDFYFASQVTVVSLSAHTLLVVFLQLGDQEMSQEWKLKLEAVQRRDRKLRKDGGGYEH